MTTAPAMPLRRACLPMSSIIGNLSAAWLSSRFPVQLMRVAMSALWSKPAMVSCIFTGLTALRLRGCLPMLSIVTSVTVAVSVSLIRSIFPENTHVPVRYAIGMRDAAVCSSALIHPAAMQIMITHAVNRRSMSSAAAVSSNSAATAMPTYPAV